MSAVSTEEAPARGSGHGRAHDAESAGDPEQGAEEGCSDRSGQPACEDDGSAATAGDASAEACEGLDAANAVSVLQEFIQSRSSFSPHAKILTWGFEQRLEEDTSLQFRATVSFVFGDVPHYFCGGWQTSKKKAQRDAAERVWRYLKRRFQGPQGEAVARAAIDPGSLPEAVARKLRAICGGQPRSCRDTAQAAAGCSAEGCAIEWRIEDMGPADEAGEARRERFRATLTFYVHVVPHHFAGSWCPSEEAAERDTAERVLWYFGRSSETFAAPDGVAASTVSEPMPFASSGGTGSHVAGGLQEAVEDKTLLMKVQNALQKTLAKETPPGHQVWVWSYEPDRKDPQLFRARVEVPCWKKTFLGGWCRGKKLAQRSACLAVKQHLEQVVSA